VTAVAAELLSCLEERKGNCGDAYKISSAFADISNNFGINK
jgi:hypothetical protein